MSFSLPLYGFNLFLLADRWFLACFGGGWFFGCILHPLVPNYYQLVLLYDDEWYGQFTVSAFGNRWRPYFGSILGKRVHREPRRC